jgi:hypothetical protein
MVGVAAVVAEVVDPLSLWPGGARAPSGGRESRQRVVGGAVADAKWSEEPPLPPPRLALEVRPAGGDGEEPPARTAPPPRLDRHDTASRLPSPVETFDVADHRCSELCFLR